MRRTGGKENIAKTRVTHLEDSFSLLLCRCHTLTSTLLCGSFKASSIFLLRKTKVLWSAGYYICSTKWDLILTQISHLNFIIAGHILSQDVLFCLLYLYISLCRTFIYKDVLNYHLTCHRFLDLQIWDSILYHKNAVQYVAVIF